MAIKEFLLADSRLCTRAADGITVMPGPEAAAFATALRQFHQEAQLLRKIQHPQVAGLLEMFEENGMACLVMELVEGKTLEEWVLARDPSPDGAMALFERLLQSVEAVHRAGLVHRDLNPRNVIIRARDGSRW